MSNSLTAELPAEVAPATSMTAFEDRWRQAAAYAQSTLIPAHFQGKKNIANVLIACEMADACGCQKMMFMQNCYIVHGKLGLETKLAIAMLNMSGKIRGSLTYRIGGQGPARMCTVTGICAKTGDAHSAVCTMQQAKAAGWMDKKDSMWLKLPDLMLQYRAAIFLIRTHWPEVILGMQTRDELADIGDDIQEVEATVLDADDDDTDTDLEIDASETQIAPAELESYHARLTEATSVVDVTDIETDGREELDAELFSVLQHWCNSRREELKACRGEKSNPKSAGVT